MASWEVGDDVTDTVNFAVNGVSTDPGSVTATVTDPSGNVTSYAVGAGINHLSVGNFQLVVKPNIGGTWIVKWNGTLPVEQQTTTAFWVYSGWAAKPLLVTPWEIQHYTGETMTEDELQFGAYIIEALQDELEQRMNRALSVRTFTETYELDGGFYTLGRGGRGQELQLYKQPVVSVASVTIAGNLMDPGAYQVMPYGIDFSSVLALGVPIDWWGIGVLPIVVTYTGGYNGVHDVPGARTLLLRVASQEFLARRNNVQGVKRLAVGRGILYDFGTGGLEGFGSDDLKGLSRLKKRVVAI